jgi:hypothetical protein
LSTLRRLYEAGLDRVAIQQNLGHADVKMTLGYIGELDAEVRRPPAIYGFDLKSMNGGAMHERIDGPQCQ